MPTLVTVRVDGAVRMDQHRGRVERRRVELAVEPGAVVAGLQREDQPRPVGGPRAGAAGAEPEQRRLTRDVTGGGRECRTHLGGRPVVAAEQRGGDTAGSGRGDGRAGTEVPPPAAARR